MKNTLFTGMATAIVTPMTKTDIDYDALGRFLDFQIDSGINGIVVMGTTGENATIEPEDQDKVIRCPAQRNQRRSGGVVVGDGRTVYEYYQNYATNTASSPNITLRNGSYQRNVGFRKFGAMKQPSVKLLLIDCDTDRDNGVWNLVGMSFSQYKNRYSMRHGGGMNALWADLHASYEKTPLQYNNYNKHFDLTKSE